MSRLKNKVAIITGGAGGIGKGIATAYAKEGAKVVIVDLNEEMGNETERALESYVADCMFIQADLTDHDELPKIIQKVIDHYGKIDVLVNNAHATKLSSFEDTTKELFDLSFNTGFYPTVYLMQEAIPYLKETKGSVINFASGAGLKGDANQTSYVAAKEAIRGISRVAANELGEYGINVNLISPIANSEGVQQWSKENPNYFNSMLSGIPMGRLGDPEEDIGRVAVFLASDDANYITGQTMMVDGGSIKLR